MLTLFLQTVPLSNLIATSQSETTDINSKSSTVGITYSPTLRLEGQKYTNKRNGSISVLMSIMLVALCLLGVLAINLSQLQLARTEAQIIADSASLSGAAAFGEGSRFDPEQIAIEIASQNTILGRRANISSAKISRGKAGFSESGTTSFVVKNRGANALRVELAAGPGESISQIPFLFPFMQENRFFSINSGSTSAKLAHDVVLVLDRSISMNYTLEGTYPPPINPFRANAQNFPHPYLSRWSIMLKSLPPMFEGFEESEIEERFGLVTFGSHLTFTHQGKRITYQGATRDIELNRDSSLITKALDSMFDDLPMISQTWIDFGIDAAAKMLTEDKNREFAFKTMVVLTDGEQFPRSRLHYEAAERAAALGIVIHTISFLPAGRRGVFEMKDLAAIGAGKSFNAPDGPTLVHAFKSIADTVPIALIE